MVNVLIVDDEIIAINGVLDGVNWDKLEVDSVFTANSMASAQSIFSKNQIDIMICDIEMPQGTGLDLLKWTRANHPYTECIFLTCHAEFEYAREALSLGSFGYLLKPTSYNELEEYIAKAIEYIKEKRLAEKYKEYGKIWINNIVDKAKTKTVMPPKEEDLILEAVKFIKENLSANITTKSVAEHVFMNPDHFNRIFKKKKGISIGEYIIQERMFLAKELLVNSDLNISTIAIEVGYNNYSHFTKMFKKIYGMTPSEYKESFKS